MLRTGMMTQLLTKYMLIVTMLVCGVCVARAGEPDSRALPDADGRPVIFFGIGYDDLTNRSGAQAAELMLEASAWPLASARSADETALFRLWPRAAMEVSTIGSVFLGLGLAGEWFPFANSFHVELGVLVGTQRRDGKNFPLQLRTQIAAGYVLENDEQIALVINHKSNNNWGPRNSASEAILLRYGVRLDRFR